MLLEDTRAVLSLGKLCEDHGKNYQRTSGQKPQLIKDGRRIKCSTENYVPIVVPGLSTCSSSSATATSPTSVLQEAVIPTLHPASTRSESMSEEVRGNSLREKQNYKGFLQKTHSYGAEDALVQSCPERKIWWLITADHKVLSEGCESRNNHRYAVVVKGFSNSMDSILSVQNKKLPRRPRRA